MPAKTGTIRQQIHIPDIEPRVVYHALLDPKKHSAFTGAKATGVPKPGGRFTAWDKYITGKNLELVEEKRIVQEWKTSEWPADSPSSIVRFAFKPYKGGTQLTMVHSKVPLDQVAKYREGWVTSYWDPLKEYFQRRQAGATSKC